MQFSDYGSFVTAQLEDIVSSSTTPTYKRISTANAIGQRDLCYKIGSGTQGDKTQKEILTVERLQRDAIPDRVQSIIDARRPMFNRIGLSTESFDDGFILRLLPNYYRERNLAIAAIEIYEMIITKVGGCLDLLIVCGTS